MIKITDVGAHYDPQFDKPQGYAHLTAKIDRLERELAEAVSKERERCAKVCEKRANGNSGKVDWWLMSAAAAIRKGE
jgi:hypothetical protein